MNEVGLLAVETCVPHSLSHARCLDELFGAEALEIWRGQAQRRARRDLPSDADAEDAVQIAVQSVLMDLMAGKPIRSAGYLWGALPFAVSKVKRVLSRRLPGTRAEPVQLLRSLGAHHRRGDAGGLREGGQQVAREPPRGLPATSGFGAQLRRDRGHPEYSHRDCEQVVVRGEEATDGGLA